MLSKGAFTIQGLCFIQGSLFYPRASDISGAVPRLFRRRLFSPQGRTIAFQGRRYCPGVSFYPGAHMLSRCIFQSQT